jgi:hypothetical protein
MSDRFPKADRNSELQQLSINAFTALLPVGRFVFRPEPNPDAGVDGHIELKSEGRYLNLRAQVQFKGTDSEHRNNDGSVSVSVKVNNLRYLLNAATSLYVLYVAPRNELRYVWARAEQKRLNDSNADWEQQADITLRFTTVLDGPALDEIYEHVRKETQLQAGLAEILSNASSFDFVAVDIDKATFQITDPTKAKEILLKSGTLIVSAGYAERVERLAALLDPQTARIPRILLVRAYAEHASGRFVCASALLAEAAMHASELSEDEQQFLQFMRDGCDYQTGKLTLAEFAARLAERQESQTGRFELSYRLNHLRQKLQASRELQVRQQTLRALKALLVGVLDADDISNAFKLHARAVGLEAEGQEFTLRFSFEASEEAMKRHFGRADNLAKLGQRYLESFRGWEDSILTLEHEARTVGHLPVLSDAILIRLSVTFFHLMFQRRLGQMLGLRVEIRPESVQTLIDQVKAVIESSVQLNRYESELRAKMLLADYFELVDRRAEALELARDVAAKAQALNYALPLGRALDHLNGKGPLAASEAVLAPKSEQEKLTENAAMSDQTLRAHAAQALRVFDVPENRLQVVERQYFTLRESSRDRLAWCRHLDTVENTRHMMSQATIYKDDPDRICVCHLHAVQSATPNPHWQTVFEAFKKANCESCSDRQPFQK